jgi:hypothetical protein
MKKIILIATTLLLVSHVGTLLYDAGVFLDITNQGLECSKVNNIHGPEDMEISQNTLFISSTYLPLRYHYEVGEVYSLDLTKENSKPRVLIDKSFNLSPHGIYAKSFDGVTRLWIINHSKSGDSIEIFDYINNKAVFIKSIKSKLYKHNNDIVAINKDQFYVTHDHGSETELGMTIENFSRMGRGYLTFFNGKEVSIVAKNLSFANGIQVIGSKLYMAQMLAKKIDVYKYYPSGQVELEDEIKVPYPVDNISILNNKELILATHPKMLKLKSHAENGKNTSPSVILKLNLLNNKTKILYADTGKTMSGSSVGIIHKKTNKIFIGNIYEDFFLRCKLND